MRVKKKSNPGTSADEYARGTERNTEELTLIPTTGLTGELPAVLEKVHNT